MDYSTVGKMILEKYEGKNVVIETDDHKIFRGLVTDYTPSFDNENGKPSIIIHDQHGHYVEFYEEDIETIEVVS